MLNKSMPLQKVSNLPNFQNYIYLFLLLSFSGNPFFIAPEISKTFFTITTVILTVIHYRKLENFKSKYLYIFLAFYSVIFASQFIVLGFVSLPGILGFMLKLIFGYIIISTIGSNFRFVYLNTIYFISIISLLGFIINLLGVDLPALLQVDEATKSIFFYTQKFNGVRNSGMFWEPGAFACYILLGFSLYIGEVQELLKENTKQIVVIVLALLTSFSSTGYIVFFLIVIYTIFSEYLKQNILVTFPLIIAVYFGFQFFSNAEFLESKMDNQYEVALEREGEFAPDRFSALLFDLHYIKKHPLIGNGLHEKTRFADHPDLIGEELGHGNGFSNFLASMGVLSLLLYSYFILRYKIQSKLIFLLIILTLLQGEPLMNYPMFLTIPFIFLFNKRYLSLENRNKVIQNKNSTRIIK